MSNDLRIFSIFVVTLVEAFIAAATTIWSKSCQDVYNLYSNLHILFYIDLLFPDLSYNMENHSKNIVWCIMQSLQGWIHCLLWNCKVYHFLVSNRFWEGTRFHTEVVLGTKGNNKPGLSQQKHFIVCIWSRAGQLWGFSAIDRHVTCPVRPPCFLPSGFCTN